MASKPVRTVGAASVYDAVAEDYAKTYFDELERKPFDRGVLVAFAAPLTGKGLVADIGCGPGQVARFLEALGLEVRPPYPFEVPTERAYLRLRKPEG